MSYDQRLVSVAIPVYRDAARAIALVGELHRQRLPPSHALDIVVVDDGSGDGTAERMEASIGQQARVLRLDSNSGRSTTLNHAVHAARGDAVLIIDCDCLPSDDGLLARHLQALSDGAVASIGSLQGDGVGFWHRYQTDASRRRSRQHGTGASYAGTSANLMVARSAFEQCGGFDAGYGKYGFEDRDLLIRLSVLGRIEWTPDAVARHMDQLSLRSVSRKMLESGEHSSTRFANRHPLAYRELGYATVDARCHPWLRPLAGLAGKHCDALARFGDSFLESRLLPYGIKRVYVKATSGLSYLAGTARARKLQTPGG